MKNIFDLLFDQDRTIKKETFDSFSNWIFPGNDSLNELSRTFLYWSILTIVKDSKEKMPNNQDFFDFFNENREKNLGEFLNLLSLDPEIYLYIEQELESIRIAEVSNSVQSSYQYFINIIIQHVESQTLFPDQTGGSEKIALFKKKGLDEVNNEDDKKFESELKNVSDKFYLIIAFLLAAYFFFNFIYF